MLHLLSKASEIIVGDQELTQNKQRLISLILMMIATGLAWIPLKRTAILLFFVPITTTTKGFAPDFITAMIALVIVLPLYFRNILKWKKTSVYSILSFAVNLTLIATFCKIILGEGFIFSVYTISLGLALILTWLGIRPVAGIAWIAVFVIGIIALQVRNYVMGIYGYLFILLGFLGLILHMEFQPGEFYEEFRRDFRGTTALTDEIRKNVNSISNI
jgi:hypothetical protein